MPMEHPSYRDNLERICDAFPNKEMLNVSEVKRFTGLDRENVKRLFCFKNGYISVASLARQMSS